jgi:hypothetical protein
MKAVDRCDRSGRTVVGRHRCNQMIYGVCRRSAIIEIHRDDAQGVAMEGLGPRIGVGKVADVYEFGGHALKLYKSQGAKVSAFREAANLAVVNGQSLPTPKVHSVGRYFDRWGIVMDRALQSSGCGRQMSGNQPLDAEAMVQLHAAIHSCSGNGLMSLKERLSANIVKAKGPDESLKTSLLRKLSTLPDGDRICHGDFHPLNIVGKGAAALVVDWLDACRGPPAADVCRTYLLLRKKSPEAAQQYVRTYAAVRGVYADDIMVWLPLVAAARLAENVPEESGDLLHLSGLPD